MRRSRTERGAIGGVEGLAFGVLLFVFGTLVFTTAWGVIDAKLATSAAAREATRAYVEAVDEQRAQDDASEAAVIAMNGHGRQLVDLEVQGDFGRCERVAIEVTTTVPRIALPLIGRSAGTYVVSAVHSERVDPYRSGLNGAAACPQ